MKRTFSLIVLMAVMCSCLAMTAHAADYSFTTAASVDYYDYTSYEDAYGSQYNYGGSNVVDYQIPELEYGAFSTTQTGIMEKSPLPGLQASVSTTPSGDYGVSGDGTPVILPGVSSDPTPLPDIPSFTELTDGFCSPTGLLEGSPSLPSVLRTIISGREKLLPV